MNYTGTGIASNSAASSLLMSAVVNVSDNARPHHIILRFMMIL